MSWFKSTPKPRRETTEEGVRYMHTQRAEDTIRTSLLATQRVSTTVGIDSYEDMIRLSFIDDPTYKRVMSEIVERLGNVDMKTLEINIGGPNQEGQYFIAVSAILK